MFLCKNIVTRTNAWQKLLLNNAALNIIPSQIKYSGVAVCQQKKYLYNHGHFRYRLIISNLFKHRKYSKNLLDGDAGELTVQHGRVHKNITEIFPLPRVTLNELFAKTPNKIFEIHYKQTTVAPKGRKKTTDNNLWTCTYVFDWPEKMKFESTAMSKRQAAEKAATQALHWLYVNRRIDSRGHPIYDENVIQDIRNSLNDPIRASISDKSMERIEKAWSDYELGIKSIFDATFDEAKKNALLTPATLNKDSTIDEDDLSEDDGELNTMMGDTAELKSHVHPVYGRLVEPPSKSEFDNRNRILRQKFDEYFEELTPLPIDEYRDLIISAIKESQVTIIVGAAGCGKSTRVPAAVLRHWGAKTAAIVSEPRRVAAIGLSERVASELSEDVGESIGYQVRLRSKTPKPVGGSILYCTSGVLLRRLQMNPGLEGCTHVIIDEAHERDVNTDLTLLLLKRALKINPDLKIVIMSATLDTEVFTRYFGTSPVIEVPGRTFPVSISYLEDIQDMFRLRLPNTMYSSQKMDERPQIKCQEVADLIKAVDKKEKEGAILVFLPGWAEIKQTKQLLDEHYGNSSIHMILPVHSRLSTEDQTKMFTTPPPGIRKIVLSTNVAETSITIPDVVYVIDTGAHKENRIKEGTGIASLETVWVSLAGAKQRTGRAGRVQPGHCYRMYTRAKEAEFVEHTTPEILRIPLVQTVLDCKAYAPDEKIASFLSQLPEPPSEKSIKFAVDDLKDLGAFTEQEQLTRLGCLLSSLTVHPRIGRSLLHSAVIGNVVAMANMAAHCSSNTEVFMNAADRRDEIREIKQNYSPTSDYAALYWIQEEFERSSQEGGKSACDRYCEKYGLRGDRLGFIRSLSDLHLEQLLKTSIIAPTTEVEELNRFSGIEELMHGVLLSGADALLTTRRQVKTKGKLKTVNEVVTSIGDRAHIGSESVNKNITKRNKSWFLCHFGGQHSAERRALVVYKTSLIPPHTAILFCKGPFTKEYNDETATLRIPKHRLSIHVPASQIDAILKVREMLWNTFEYYIARDIKTLDFDENTKVSAFKTRLMKTVARILVEGHREYIEEKARMEEIEEFR